MPLKKGSFIGDSSIDNSGNYVSRHGGMASIAEEDSLPEPKKATSSAVGTAEKLTGKSHPEIDISF